MAVFLDGMENLKDLCFQVVVMPRRPKSAKKRISTIHIFIAHSSRDNGISKKIAEALKGEGFGVWYDEWKIKVGDSISQKISSGLQQGDFLVIILSKNSIQSQWVQKELAAALALEGKKSMFILPVQIDGCEIPVLLQDRKYADFGKGFSQGLDELLDAINAPGPISQYGLPIVPSREPSVQELVDSLGTLSGDGLDAKISSLSIEKKKETIIEIMDRLSMADIHEVSGLAYLFSALDICLQENRRPSLTLFQVFFREFAFRSLPFCKEKLVPIVAKYVQFNSIRDWICGQNLTDWFVSEFERSPTFVSGALNSEIVANLGPVLSRNHIDRIVEAALTNNQIYQSWQAPSHLRRLFSSCIQLLTDKQRQGLKKKSLI
jgi:hypothetical protein